MAQKTDRQTGTASAVLQIMHWPAVVKRELSMKAKLSTNWVIHVPTITMNNE